MANLAKHRVVQNVKRCQEYHVLTRLLTCPWAMTAVAPARRPRTGLERKAMMAWIQAVQNVDGTEGVGYPR